MGYASDAFARVISRPLLLAGASVLLASALALLGAAPGGSDAALYPGIVLAGAAYGSCFALGPALVADRFGSRAFAATSALSTAATAIGSYMLGVLVVGMLVSNPATVGPADVSRGVDGNEGCLGARCFGSSLYVLAGVALVGASAAAVLHARVRLRLYDSVTGFAINYALFLSSTGGIGPAARLARRNARHCCCSCGKALVGEDGDELGGGDGGGGGSLGYH